MSAPPARVPDRTSDRVVVIGVSAGAIHALSQILPALPAHYPFPVLVVVHVPRDRNALTTLFERKCSLPVREADDKEPIATGITIAPPDYHMLIESGRTIALSGEEPVHFSRPSIDALFESAADALGPALIGVVLTGANEDGAAGLKAIAAAGGTALVQDPATAYAAAMPDAALKACPAALKLDLDAIAAFLIEAGHRP